MLNGSPRVEHAKNVLACYVNFGINENFGAQDLRKKILKEWREIRAIFFSEGLNVVGTQTNIVLHINDNPQKKTSSPEAIWNTFGEFSYHHTGNSCVIICFY